MRFTWFGLIPQLEKLEERVTQLEAEVAALQEE